jgi:hypothetical protein
MCCSSALIFLINLIISFSLSSKYFALWFGKTPRGYFNCGMRRLFILRVFHKMLSHVFYHVFTIPWICISLIIKVWYSDIPIHTNIKIPYQFLTIIKSCLLEIHLSERNCVNKKIKMKIKQFAIIESTHAKICMLQEQLAKSYTTAYIKGWLFT